MHCIYAHFHYSDSDRGYAGVTVAWRQRREWRRADQSEIKAS